jgi:isopentenyl-diphosphate Delta-isomerase
MDFAKTIALGADMAGIAGPFLRAAAQGPDAVHDQAVILIETLRVVMFAVGAQNLREFRARPRLELCST